MAVICIGGFGISAICATIGLIADEVRTPLNVGNIVGNSLTLGNTSDKPLMFGLAVAVALVTYMAVKLVNWILLE